MKIQSGVIADSKRIPAARKKKRGNCEYSSALFFCYSRREPQNCPIVMFAGKIRAQIPSHPECHTIQRSLSEMTSVIFKALLNRQNSSGP